MFKVVQAPMLIGMTRWQVTLKSPTAEIVVSSEDQAEARKLAAEVAQKINRELPVVVPETEVIVTKDDDVVFTGKVDPVFPAEREAEVKDSKPRRRRKSN